MSGTGNADVTITGLTWAKVLVIVGTVRGSALATIVVLLTVVYGGITERIAGLDTRVRSVEKGFRDAVTSAVKVQDLLTKARPWRLPSTGRLVMSR